MDCINTFRIPNLISCYHSKVKDAGFGRYHTGSPYIIRHVCVSSKRYIVVDNSNEGRTTVPQDAGVNVNNFNLAENNIEEIDNSSFVRYTNVMKLNLNRNSRKSIGENTLAQNKNIWEFNCKECNIQRLPEHFGNFLKLRLISLSKGIISGIATTIFRYPYFEACTSLDYVFLPNIPLKNADIIKLPP